MNKDDLYEILEIDKNATEEEIKKSYKKLILKYHPDKINKDKDMDKDKDKDKDRFIKIRYAYEVLIDKKLRNEYNDMTNNNKIKFSKNLFKLFSDNIDDILLFFCDFNFDYDDYKKSIKNRDYNTVINCIFSKYITKKNLDIVDFIECDLIDRYNDNYMIVEVMRKTRSKIKLCVPLRNEINIYYGEGEIDKYGRVGNLILHTITNNKSEYYFKKSDLYYKIKNIDLNKEKKIIYNHINGETITIDYNNIMDGKYIILQNMGLPLNINNSIFKKRGDLVCEI
jgi:DnaJ-class molecular chaperone